GERLHVAGRPPCAADTASSTSSACGFLRFPSLGPEAPLPRLSPPAGSRCRFATVVGAAGVLGGVQVVKGTGEGSGPPGQAALRGLPGHSGWAGGGACSVGGWPGVGWLCVS